MIHMDVLLYAMFSIVFYVVYVFFTMYFVRNDKINLWNHICIWYNSNIYRIPVFWMVASLSNHIIQLTICTYVDHTDEYETTRTFVYIHNRKCKDYVYGRC